MSAGPQLGHARSALQPFTFYVPAVKVASGNLPLPFDWGYQEKLTWYREWNYNATIALPKPFPFNQKDWPNPAPVQWYKEWSSAGRVGAPVRTTPFNKFDWPNPPRTNWYQDWVQNLLETTLTPVAGPAPFSQDDWPNPIQPFRPDFSYFEVMDLSRNNSLGKTFKQTDWPNPYPVQWYRDWVDTGNALVPTTPFNKFDWPNPKSVTWYQSWVQNQSLKPFPFNQQDWPNPQRISWYQSWLQSQSLKPIPFNQKDWPNPSSITWYKDWNNNPILIVPRNVPFKQLDWPLPSPTYWTRDWNQNLVLTFGPTPTVVTDLHFKPIRNSMGRMGNLGGLH